MKNLSLFLFCLMIIPLSALEAGEKLVFNIKYGIISAAQATLELEEVTYKDSIPCYQITASTRTYPFFDHFFKVRDRIESVVDRDKFISYKFEKKLQEGKYKQHRIHLYYPDQNISYYLKYSRKSGVFQEERMDIPDHTQDILSAFYWYRQQSVNVGDTLEINVTVDGRNVITEVVALKLETIDTVFGEKECLVIEPLLKTEAIFKQTGRILIWLINDENKIPVKLESQVSFGSFKAFLEEAIIP